MIYPPTQRKKTSISGRNEGRALLIMMIGCLTLFAVAKASAVNPPPDGGYPARIPLREQMLSSVSPAESTTPRSGLTLSLLIPLAWRIRQWGLQRLVAILAVI
jgi:hypothetical protein